VENPATPLELGENLDGEQVTNSNRLDFYFFSAITIARLVMFHNNIRDPSIQGNKWTKKDTHITEFTKP